MIENIIIQYLNENMDVLASAKHHDQLGDRYIIVERTGSGNSNMVQSATFAMQSYGVSEVDAASLNEKLKRVIQGAVLVDNIFHVRIVNDYPFDDLTKKKNRYQAIIEITYMN